MTSTTVVVPSPSLSPRCPVKTLRSSIKVTIYSVRHAFFQPRNLTEAAQFPFLILPYSVECPTYKLLNSNYSGQPSVVQENVASAEGARRLRACPSRKILNLKALKGHFQHSQSDSCVKKVPKIDYFLLNFDKTSVVIICIA